MRPQLLQALGYRRRHRSIYLFYFSCTTISTVGYGDIYPATYRARSLVIIEPFVGTFYIAILISRLTGFCTTRKSEREDKDDQVLGGSTQTKG